MKQICERIGHVDVIVLFDVIEHLPDPRETLALCHRYLNPGGIIVLTTGDFGSALARLAGATMAADDAAAAPLVLYARRAFADWPKARIWQWSTWTIPGKSSLPP